MKSINLIFFLFFIALFSKAQSCVPKRVIDLKSEISTFDIDCFGSIYIAYANGNLVKIDTLGKETFIPNKKTKSCEWQIDASNPYKVIFFNRDMQNVEIFNSDFAKINNIDLTFLNTDNVGLLCGSYNNSFWILTSQNKELIRLSEQLDVASKTNINFIKTNIDSICMLREVGKKVFISQNNGYSYIFDLYGNLQLRFDKVSSAWGFNDDVLYYLQNDTIIKQHIYLHQYDDFKYKINNIKNFRVLGNYKAILSNHKIYLFR